MIKILLALLIFDQIKNYNEHTPATYISNGSSNQLDLDIFIGALIIGVLVAIISCIIAYLIDTKILNKKFEW